MIQSILFKSDAMFQVGINTVQMRKKQDQLLYHLRQHGHNQRSECPYQDL